MRLHEAELNEGVFEAAHAGEEAEHYGSELVGVAEEVSR